MGQHYSKKEGLVKHFHSLKYGDRKKNLGVRQTPAPHLCGPFLKVFLLTLTWARSTRSQTIKKGVVMGFFRWCRSQIGATQHRWTFPLCHLQISPTWHKSLNLSGSFSTSVRWGQKYYCLGHSWESINDISVAETVDSSLNSECPHPPPPLEWTPSLPPKCVWHSTVWSYHGNQLSCQGL